MRTPNIDISHIFVSSGPLITKELGEFYSIIGVVSWGFGCASQYPGVQARLSTAVSSG